MPANNTIKAKWPGLLWQWGFIPAARIFVRNYARLDPPLTDFQALLILNIVDYIWSEGQVPFPPLEQLAADLGVGADRITQALGELAAHGYIKVVHTKDEKTKLDKTGYVLDGLYTRLEELVEKEDLQKGKAWVGRRSSSMR